MLKPRKCQLLRMIHQKVIFRTGEVCINRTGDSVGNRIGANVKKGITLDRCWLEIESLYHVEANPMSLFRICRPTFGRIELKFTTLLARSRMLTAAVSSGRGG